MPGLLATIEAPPLADLAEKINQEHAACQSAVQAGLEHALECGRLLLEVKAGLPHGEFQSWVKANCDFSDRTARGYLRVAKRWPELSAKRQRVAVLSYREALKLLAAPKDDSLPADIDWDAETALHDRWRKETDALRQRLEAADAIRDDAARVRECNAIVQAARTLANETTAHALDCERAAGKLLAAAPIEGTLTDKVFPEGFAPEPGQCLIGSHESYPIQVFVAESLEHPGYWYAHMMDFRGQSDIASGTVTGFRRPAVADHLGTAFKMLLEESTLDSDQFGWLLVTEKGSVHKARQLCEDEARLHGYAHSYYWRNRGQSA